MGRTALGRWWHVGGVVLGLVVTVGAAYHPVTAAPERLGIDVRVTAAPTGELDVAPRGAFLAAERLRVDERVVGVVSVRNQTGAALSVTALVDSPPPGFGDRMRLRVRAGSETVVEGTLDDLATGTRSWLVASGHAVDVTVEAWAAAAGDGFQAGTVDLALRFETQPASP